ncbi:MAG: DNA translocase FtsK 4TM domain-containing protein, partial [Desulfuromonadaceae bacterium]
MNKSQPPLIRDHLKKEIAGLFWLASGVFILLSLLSFHNDDPSFNTRLPTAVVHNWGGMVGANLADLLIQLLGVVSFILPLACFLLAYRLLKFSAIKIRLYKGGALLGLMFSLAGLIALRFREIHLFGQRINEAGGFAGRVLSEALSRYLNLTG